jgi:antibiotic biosynthesis monooxygenase (ABM) superfamily enzyme
MPHILIRHRVADFVRWKTTYETHAGVRKIVGLREEYLWRNEADSSEVFILFATDNLNTAQAYVNSPELRATMKDAGVTDRPDVYVLR